PDGFAKQHAAFQHAPRHSGTRSLAILRTSHGNCFARLMARGPQSKEKKIGKEGSISRRSRRQREKATAAAMCRRPRFLSGLLLLLARFDSPPMSPGGTGRSSVWLSFHVKSGNERSTPRRALVGQPPSSGSAARLLFLEARGRPCACAQATALERRVCGRIRICRSCGGRLPSGRHRLAPRLSGNPRRRHAQVRRVLPAIAGDRPVPAEPSHSRTLSRSCHHGHASQCGLSRSREARTSVLGAGIFVASWCPGSRLRIKEVPCPAKHILGAYRPGAWISVLRRDRCRTAWILPSWAAASTGFARQRGWPGWRQKNPCSCSRPAHLAKARAAEPAAWHSRTPRPGRSPDSATCSPDTRKSYAPCASTPAWNSQVCTSWDARIPRRIRRSAGAIPGT